MLKKLQHRFVLITMLSLVLVVFVQIVAVNTMNVIQRDHNCRDILVNVVKHGELDANVPGDDYNYFRDFINPFRSVDDDNQAPYLTKYFVLSVDENNVVTYINGKNVETLTETEMVDYASEVLESGDGFGFVGTSYRYYSVTDNGRTIIGFLNVTQDLRETMKLAGISMFVGLFMIVLLILPVIFFAKKAVKPVERSIEKQKQFITDASHELKTPIAIISANAEVLEMCNGEDEWITSIKNQTGRLNTLVKNLVTLSKLEETRNTPTIERFNLSDTIIDVAKPFETPAANKNVKFEYDISDNIMFKGSESEIRQLCSILCDNAVKYTTEGGTIKISCRSKGRGINLEFTNDCDNISKDQLPKLFDRFYRTDNSRNSSTGGHGIGLSIAQCVVERNNGTIAAVSNKPNTITFRINF